MNGWQEKPDPASGTASGAAMDNMNGRPPKPAGSRWTDEQWRAITERGGDVLVAAAAGSGKTAVLVERIIRLISDEKAAVDVDRLLVSTFTKAAADEMRHRIREALERALAENPASVHLRRQLALVHKATVTTIHGFCLEVIRRHFHRIPLDPGFRVAGDTEAELLKQEVLETLFEELYAASGADDPFWELLDRYGGERSDAGLFELVVRLYEFSRSHPFPEEWLRRSAAAFRSGGPPGGAALWMEALLEEARRELEGLRGRLEEALRLCRLPGGPAPYADTIGEDAAALDNLLAAGKTAGWDELREMLGRVEFGRLKPCKGDEYDKNLQDEVKAIRNRVRDGIAALRDELLGREAVTAAEEHAALAPLMERLAEIVIAFGRRFAAAKAEKKLVDFSDLEHFALKALCDGTDDEGRLIPSAAALEYRAYFEEVLIDEYQDTNQVQEAVLSLVSRSGRGNRFMVGDVKQSIYRFRLADPGIFLDKYRMFSGEPQRGTAIDLARNFRSRPEVTAGVNFLFRQLMRENTAELDYDEKAELKCGADYPDRAPGEKSAVDVVLIRRTEGAASDAKGSGVGGAAAEPALDGRSGTGDAGLSGVSPAPGGSQPDPARQADGQAEEERHDMETAELEARFMALTIRELLGLDGGIPFAVVDRETKRYRPVRFRDIVILLRATQSWAPVIAEQLRMAGIPCYAELATGYFEATEVEVMLSLLKIIDNPYQDIPLAAVLRSPMFGLSAEQLARVRLADRKAPYFEAVVRCADPESTADPELKAILRDFLDKLEDWRTAASMSPLPDLLLRLYRETGYFDYVGGLPGGIQRQANLKALYDRARQFEATNLRGLFRFLRFIQRMRESGGDLGAAKALGEQEDVVRIMSIHKSKGLEFPVVIVAGLSKMFNLRDAGGDVLMHSRLGIGPRIVDSRLRVSYPSLAHQAIARTMRKETLAEEMRILYVALTRAKEKLILLGTTRNPEALLKTWAACLSARDWPLPAHAVLGARSYLDWIGAALIRHPALKGVREAAGLGLPGFAAAAEDPSRFSFAILPESRLSALGEAAAARSREEEERLAAVARLAPVRIGSPEIERKVRERLEWTYRFEQASRYYAKTTVTELKRLREAELVREEDDGGFRDDGSRIAAALHRRPRFLERRRMNAAERGSAYHAVMQQIPLIPGIDAALVGKTLDRMEEREMLTAEQRAEIDPEVIAAFFATDIGRRLLASGDVRREVPFTFGLPVRQLHPEAHPDVAEETVLIQGVIDCMFREDDGLVLIDYKTEIGRAHV